MQFPAWLRKEEQLSPTTPPVPESTNKGEKMIKGIDVSKWQKGIDWKAAKDDGNVFAFAKATDGIGSIDSQFASHREGAKAAGLLFGGYHFFRFEHSVVDQANLFLKTLGDIKGEIQPVVDVEWDKFSEHYGEGKEMDAEAFSRVAAFCAIIESATKAPPIIYTNAYFWKDFTHPGEIGFSDTHLWVPNYHAKTIQDVKIPAPWKNAAFWQYSESIKAYGVEAVDGDYFLGTGEELQKLVRQ